MHLQNLAAQVRTGAGAIGHQHVAVETVALEAAEGVHAAVLAGPWLQPTLIEICKEERKSKDNMNPPQEALEARMSGGKSEETIGDIIQSCTRQSCPWPG